MPKRTFAHDAQSYAGDVQKFVQKSREELSKLVDRHAEAQASATPEGDEGAVWTAYTRVGAPFDDVERALSALFAVADTVNLASVDTINARGTAGDAELDAMEPSTHEPDQMPKGVKPVTKAPAKKTTPAKRAAAQKRASKKAGIQVPSTPATKKVTGD
jgi:hypothetical protein